MSKSPDLGSASTFSLLDDQDLYLFNEGTHRGLASKFGAHLLPGSSDSVATFAVWAPNAERISVIGDFNDWRGDKDGLSPRASSGVWEGMVSGVERGQVYKYEIVTQQG